MTNVYNENEKNDRKKTPKGHKKDTRQGYNVTKVIRERATYEKDTAYRRRY
jgi:hypothetical protein